MNGSCRLSEELELGALVRTVGRGVTGSSGMGTALPTARGALIKNEGKLKKHGEL